MVVDEAFGNGMARVSELVNCLLEHFYAKGIKLVFTSPVLISNIAQKGLGELFGQNRLMARLRVTAFIANSLARRRLKSYLARRLYNLACW